MLSSFKPEEMDLLTKHFRLTKNTSSDRELSVPAVDLLDEAKCMTYLDRVTGIFQSPSKIVTASQFSKRYSFLMIAPSLYAMTMFNKGWDHSVQNCHIESVYQDKTWLPKVRLADLQVTQPTDGDRHEWRDQMIKSIFAGNISRIWCAISKAAKIPITVLWENTAIYVYWLYEKRMEEGSDKNQKVRIHEDFQYLLDEAPASLFGYTENPLKKYNSPKCTVSTSDQPVRIRKTCCYYYRISSNDSYCSTCPIVRR